MEHFDCGRIDSAERRLIIAGTEKFICSKCDKNEKDSTTDGRKTSPVMKDRDRQVQINENISETLLDEQSGDDKDNSDEVITLETEKEKNSNPDIPDEGEKQDSPEEGDNTDIPDASKNTDIPEEIDNADTPEAIINPDISEASNNSDIPEVIEQIIDKVVETQPIDHNSNNKSDDDYNLKVINAWRIK